MIEQLLVKDPLNRGLSTQVLDYQRVMALPDSEFSAFYLKLMTQYKDKDGWWSEGKIPACFQCKKVIPGPEELRRYKGLSLHSNCFEKFYKTQRKEDSRLMKQYWDRVAQLRFK